MQQSVYRTASETGLSDIHPSQRVLLLPQCLRPSDLCPGKFSKEGLRCPDDCTEVCAIRRFRETANSQGYAGVCVAAEGSMALRFVKKLQPEAIVAVACDKELELGANGVEEIRESLNVIPIMVLIPLSKDGCVDTEVDADMVLEAINSNHHSGGTSPGESLPPEKLGPEEGL